MNDWVSALVSALALGFTVLSFWWMNWRPGRLSVGNLQSFIAGRGTTLAGVGHDEHKFWTIGLPLILLNQGASPLVIESLRLEPANATLDERLLFNATDTPAWTDDPEKEPIARDWMFLPAAIRANEVLSANFVFKSQATENLFQAKLYHYKLEVKLSGHRDWRKIKDLEFDFRDFDEQRLYELNAYYKPYYYRRGERA